MADSGKAAIEVLIAMILSVKSYSRYISGYGLAPRLSMLFALISIQPKTRLNLQAFMHSKIFRIRILINVKVFAMSEIPSIWKSHLFGNPKKKHCSGCCFYIIHLFSVNFSFKSDKHKVYFGHIAFSLEF